MKWNFGTSGQIHSLAYIICKYWYICKVLFTILFQKLKTNGKRKICKSITFVIMESYVHIKVNPKASTRCDGQSLCTFISHLVCSPWSYCHWASKKFHLYPDYISLSSEKCLFPGGIGSSMLVLFSLVEHFNLAYILRFLLFYCWCHQWNFRG